MTTRTIKVGLESRYDRQTRAGWSQTRIAKARAVVIGAGAVGNEVVKNLLLVGVRQILALDFDVVTPSNLSRCIFLRDDDVGRSKAAAVAENALRSFPDASVVGLHGDVEFDLGDAYIEDADMVLGCVDNLYARFVLNRRARQFGRTWFDGGISENATQASTYTFPGACFECGLGDVATAQMRRRFSCTGYRRVSPSDPVPTTVVTASIVGGLLVQAAVSALHGTVGGSVRTTFLLPGTAIHDELSIAADCALHASPRRAPSAQGSSGSSTNTTLRELASRLSGGGTMSLEDTRPIVRALHCQECGSETELLRLMGRIALQDSACPVCGSERRPLFVDDLSLDGPYADATLAQLGYVDGDYVHVRVRRRKVRIALAQSLWTSTGGTS